jgi:putative ABC transport system permease protein
MPMRLRMNHSPPGARRRSWRLGAPLGDLVRETWRNARARRLRTLLTAAGIVWGLALFICLSSVGEGSRLHYREKMQAIGRKVIFSFPGTIAGRSGGERSTRAVVLDRKDPPRFPESPSIERAAPELWTGPRLMKGGGRIKIVWTYGVAPATERIRNFRVGSGRFITAEDVATRARVVVLGAKVAERLFGRHDALGAMVRLDGHPFRVVGVSARKGMQMVNMGPLDDEQVLMPVTTAQALFTRSDAISYVLYDPRSRDEAEESMQRVRSLLSRHHYFGPRDDEAVEFFNAGEMMQVIENMGLALQIFLSACGLMTLAAGGVGVMNIMLVAVAERTRELALRKALGATNGDIFIGLLLETLLLTVGAGIGGLLLGWALVAGLQLLHDVTVRDDFLVSRPVLSPTTVIAAFAVLVCTGIAAGIMPARRAARLDPAEGLRDE